MPIGTMGQRLSWYGPADGIARGASGRMHLRNNANEIWITNVLHALLLSVNALLED